MNRIALSLALCFCLLLVGSAWADDLQTGTSPDLGAISAPPSSSDLAVSSDLSAKKVVSIDVEGNEKVVKEHILGVISTKVGAPVNEDQLQKDAEAIYDLGFFASVDYRLDEAEGGVKVTFVVQENPVVKELHFTGNTVYTEKQLKDLCFTQPGLIFNRNFFRNDLQRIKEKYQKDGYVMMRVDDVRIEDGVVTVYITEPRIGEIIVQGNKKTKTYVITRQLKIKPGDLFNATILRHSINKLQQLGYFEDVNVGFEPGEKPDLVNLVITVSEAKTGRIGLSIGHGSSSGWSGGLSYEDDNWKGLGNQISTGFQLGDREQYWISYSNPYMDAKTYAWKMGVYKRKWTDVDSYIRESSTDYIINYDEDKKGFYVGAGKKFARNEHLSWYLTLDYHKTDVTVDWPNTDSHITPEIVATHMMTGTNFSITGTIARDMLNEYLSYPNGDVESINIENAMNVLGGDWNYVKYWMEARYYVPIPFINNFIPRKANTKVATPSEEDIPPLFAARVRAGSSSGTVPWAEGYFLGGSTTLRGYDDDIFEGDQVFLANAEIRIPVEKAFSVVFFYDTGNAWDTTTGGGFSFSDLHDDKGIGIRVRTPLGNIRLDFAKGETENRTQFGFGEMF